MKCKCNEECKHIQHLTFDYWYCPKCKKEIDVVDEPVHQRFDYDIKRFDYDINDAEIPWSFNMNAGTWQIVGEALLGLDEVKFGFVVHLSSDGFVDVNAYLKSQYPYFKENLSMITKLSLICIL